ncbi:MAG: cytochrome P450 [Rivularia sp. (in: cyanobacteria)]
MPKSQIPGDNSITSLLGKLQWITKPLELLEGKAQKYGDIFTLAANPRDKPQVIISNPQGIEKIFTANLEQLDSGKEAGIQPLFVGKKSLLALSGKRHKRERKLLMPPFHGERMRGYGNIISNLTEQVTNRWEIGTPLSIRSSMQGISFQVILKAVFGLEDGVRYQELTRLLTQRLEGARSIFRAILLFLPILQKDWGPWSPWGRLRRNEQQINQLIYDEIAERRLQPAPSRSDILSLMMASRDEDGEPMSDLELRDELITLLIAGHETTASSLAWTFYWIHRLPEVREKLLQELDSLGENPEANDIIKLPYLNAVCQETLRIYPVVNFALPRVVKSPLEIMGYHLEPGTILSASIYLTHHREDLYPEPKQFKPERFLERQFSPYEYLPFGGGNRRCLGYAFALFEMKLVLVNILSRWQLELADSKPVKPVRRGLLMSPSDVKMVVKGKRAQNPQILQTASSSV